MRCAAWPAAPPQDLAAAILAALEHAPARSTFNITADPIRYADYVKGATTAPSGAASAHARQATAAPAPWRTIPWIWDHHPLDLPRTPLIYLVTHQPT